MAPSVVVTDALRLGGRSVATDRVCRAHEVSRSRRVVDIVAGMAGGQPLARVLRALS